LKLKLSISFFFLLLIGSLTFSTSAQPIHSVYAQTSNLNNVSTVASITGSPIGFSETSSTVKLNFTMFIIEFDKSSGSSVIYAPNGSVLVYYHFMVLQYWNDKVKDWRQAGTFQSLSWLKHDDYHYSVTELFQDASTSPRTNYTVTYDIKSDSRVKITIRIESGATRQYRLQWSFDGIVYSDWMEKKNTDGVKSQLCFGDESEDYSFIKFDWQDIYEQFKSDICSYSVGTSAQGRKADIYFGIGTVGANSVLTVDPSVAGTSSSGSAIWYPFQRKCFYANGRFWVFYFDGTNMVYRTSTDGSTWSSATTVRAAVGGQQFSVWFDGTYLHYAYAWASSICYRRGTPNSDGTITWSAVEQTVSTTYNSAKMVMVSVDSNGYVWIGYIDYDGTYYYSYVIKSGNNDGTWGTTPSGFPYYLAKGYGLVSPIPLTNGKMLVLWASDASPVYACRWDGSSWGTATSTSTVVVYSGYYYSAVAQGDDVHLVFLRNTGYDILYVKYTYSSNSFGTVTTLQAGATSTSAPVISIYTATNDLYVFWAGYPTSNHIYYRKYTASTGTWEAAVDWIAETETLTGNERLTCFYQTYSSKIGLLYMTGTASPYNVKFAYLSLNTAPNAPTLNSPAASYRFNPGASVTFSWTFSDPDAGDSQSAYQLQIGDSGFTTIYLDTGKVSSTAQNTTQTLPSNMTVGIYYWRVTTWDTYGGVQGAWSSGRAIIVDGLNLSQYTLDLKNEKVYVRAVYAYDSTPIAGANISYIGLYASANSTGWVAFDVSSLSNVDWNSLSYCVSEPTYGITYRVQNQTIAFHKLPISPFSIRGNNQITTPNWDDVNRKLSFTTSGTCIVKVGDWGTPLRVEVDGTTYTDWTYDSAKQEVTISNLASNVALIWQAGETPGGVPGGPGGVTPTPGETPVTPPVYVPPEALPLVNVGLIVIVVVVVGAYAYSQITQPKKVSQKWRQRQKQTKPVKWKKKSRFEE